MKASRSYRIALAENKRNSQHRSLDRMLPDLAKTAAIVPSQKSLQATDNVVRNTENWFSVEVLADDEILREAREMNLKARPRKTLEFALSDLKFYVAKRLAEYRKETDISKRRLIAISLERANQLIPRLKRIGNATSRKALRGEQHDWREHHITAKSSLQLKSTLVNKGSLQSNDNRDAEDGATSEVGGHAENLNGHVSSFGQVKFENGDVATVFDAEVDAEPHSTNAIESVEKCANLPFNIQYMLLGSIIDNFKREIFRYGALNFPDLLQKVGSDCAESVGIALFQRMITQGRLLIEQRPSIYLDSNHFLAFVQEL
jgi:hypothetical protein